MRKHLVADIDGVLSHAAGKRTAKQRHEFAMSFGAAGYLDLVSQCEAMKAKGMEFIPSSKCDNVLPNGRCGGHED